jgi:hypothetical protein
MTLVLHQEGFARAKQLIKQGKVDYTSSWSLGNPSPQEGNQFIANHSMEEYGMWFLALNMDEPEGTKSHYEFPLGDFDKLYREALITIERRAAQYNHPDVEAAAKQLLQLIEKKKA